MRLIPRIYILLALMCVFVGYENFTCVDTEEAPDQTTQILKEMNDFQAKDKVPTALAVPQSGHDFQSVRDDWTNRQSQLLLNGADQRLLDNINNHISSYVSENFSSKKDGDTTANPSAAPANPSADGNAAAPATTDPNAATAQNSPQQQPKSPLKFTRINDVKYEFGKDTALDFIADPGNTRLNFSQAFTQNTKFGVEHRTSDGTTQMFFKYQW